jgi:hypothetical protein
MFSLRMNIAHYSEISKFMELPSMKNVRNDASSKDAMDEPLIT